MSKKVSSSYYQDFVDRIENSSFQAQQKKLIQNIVFQAQSLEEDLENHIKRILLTRFSQGPIAIYHPYELRYPLPKSYPLP